MALRRIIEAGLFVALVAVVVTAGVARAQDPTPGVTVAPPPTPHPNAPAAPTDTIILGGSLISWVDNSDDEDGFRIRYRLSGEDADSGEFVYEVGATITSFTLPPEAPRLCGPEEYYALFLSVAAFNEFGESTEDDYGIIAECEPVPTAIIIATPTPEAVVLPATGLRGATSSWRSPYLQTIVASVLAAGGVLALAVHTARRR